MASSEKKPRSSRPSQTAFKNLYRLQDLIQELNLPDEVKVEVDACLENLEARDSYCESISSPPSTELMNLFEKTLSHPWEQLYKDGKTEWNISPRMMSGRLEGKFLKSLVSMSKAKRVLEVGLFTGSGALAMAEALPADGVVISCELDSYLQGLARTLVDQSPHGKKIEIKGGPAKTSMEKLAKDGEKFDFIFIDADKSGYLDYYNIIMDNDMLSPGGTIAVDNTLAAGFPHTPEKEWLRHYPESNRMSMGKAIKEFNAHVSLDERVNVVLVPLRDGVTLIQRKEDYEGQV